MLRIEDLAPVFELVERMNECPKPVLPVPSQIATTEYNESAVPTPDRMHKTSYDIFRSLSPVLPAPVGQIMDVAFQAGFEEGVQNQVMQETQGRTLRLLAFDGGGVRGVSSLCILKDIMSKISDDKDIKPCDYFDMMMGTSTGGLLALMLGRLEMTIDECQKEYENISEQVFGRSIIDQTFHSLTRDARYSAGEFTRAVKEVIKKKLGEDSEEALMLVDEQSTVGRKCRVAVVTTRSDDGGTPVILRTYVDQGELNKGWKIWEAARATSAAPSYFRRKKVDGISYVDGGLGFNNPANLLVHEANAIFGGGHIGCLVSLGTGMPPKVTLGHPTLLGLPKFATSLVSIATNGETVHTDLKGRSKEFGEPEEKGYWRFNLGKKLMDEPETAGGVKRGDEVLFGPTEIGKLDDWRNMPDLVAKTIDYLGQVEGDVQACANRLRKLHCLKE